MRKQKQMKFIYFDENSKTNVYLGIFGFFYRYLSKFVYLFAVVYITYILSIILYII